jgi:hypothetical protein
VGRRARHALVLTPIWGPSHSEFKAPVSHGPVTHGAIVALKLEEKNGALVLTPAWISRDMDLAEPPVIANGVVYTYGKRRRRDAGHGEGGLNSSAPRRIPLSKKAVLYALDAQTGRELYSSGSQITRGTISAACRSRTAVSTSARSTACCIVSAYETSNRDSCIRDPAFGADRALCAETKRPPRAIDRGRAGFQPIFDGKSLAGWEGNPMYWRAENGVLVGEITPATVIKSNTFIIWRGGSPRDFELKLDYRITPTGNSGINYRSVVVPDR